MTYIHFRLKMVSEQCIEMLQNISLDEENLDENIGKK